MDPTEPKPPETSTGWTTTPAVAEVPPVASPPRGTLIARARLLGPPAPPARAVDSPPPAPVETFVEKVVPAIVSVRDDAASPLGRLLALILTLGLAWALTVAIVIWVLVLIVSR